MKPPLKGTSIATPNPEGPPLQLFAPSAARNTQVIQSFVTQNAPQSGRALELASGTGQHIAALATAMPQMQWHPSDIDPDRLASIDSYASTANQHTARQLSATSPAWDTEPQSFDLIYLANLLHLIRQDEVQTLFAQTAKALKPGGIFLIYGPFMRDGQLTSSGDQRFHSSLIAQDANLGYKNDQDILDWAAAAGLAHRATHGLPANNLGFVFHKPAFTNPRRFVLEQNTPG
ncbi:DUF938 domain-containing protein [Cognatishimia sp. WU-CL00825]|uniref:DUF938 domain-containing protein n=1 Tax=Cognatishimia sp. WU-CL00825 TaxID=3127658 RepID=UPI00310B9954